MGDEVEVGQRGAGGDDLRAADHDAVIALGLDVHEHVADLLGRAVAVDRGMDDRVVPVQDALLSLAVPASRVVLVRVIEVGVGAKRGQERRLVIGAASEPAVSEPSPLGDRFQIAHAVLDGPRVAEELVGDPVTAGVGGSGDDFTPVRIVQRVVEARDRAGGVAERRVSGDVLDPLAVDVDLASIAEALQIFRAGERLSGPGAAVEHLVHGSSDRRLCQTDPSTGADPNQAWRGGHASVGPACLADGFRVDNAG